jgi:hypothetical protein
MVRVAPVVVKNGMQFFCYQVIYLTSEVPTRYAPSPHNGGIAKIFF